MLTDIGVLKEWADPDLSSGRDATLTACIAAASSYINGVRPIEQQSYVDFYDSQHAYGQLREVVDLPASRTPIVNSGSDLVVVLENDVLLTVAEGYSATAGVLIRGANLRGYCSLARNGTCWSWGQQGIRVAYKAGYAPGSIPSEIQMLANVVALAMFRSPDWLGKSAQSQGGSSLSFEKDLPPWARELLSDLRTGAW